MHESARDKFRRRESDRQRVERANRIGLNARFPRRMQFLCGIVSEHRRSVHRRQQMIPITVVVGKNVYRRDAVFPFLTPEFISEALGEALRRGFQHRGRRQKIVVRIIRVGEKCAQGGGVAIRERIAMKNLIEPRQPLIDIRGQQRDPGKAHFLALDIHRARAILVDRKRRIDRRVIGVVQPACSWNIRHVAEGGEQFVPDDDDVVGKMRRPLRREAADGNDRTVGEHV